MFLIDDLLLAPFRGIKFIAESVHDAAREQIENERQALRDEMNDLYMQLETGEITEEEFERREEEILDRLEALDETESELQGDGPEGEPQNDASDDASSESDASPEQDAPSDEEEET
jgi:predicted ribosome quality control (RQC) complex YloA/Tae2 family protein